MIYFDNAATTQPRDEVVAEMTRYLTGEYGNPSSIYGFATGPRHAVDKARGQVASLVNANADEIIFTGCGTESDNWAVKGVVESFSGKKNHIITQATEHHAVLYACHYMEKKGVRVTYLPVDANGLIDIDDLKNAISDDTALITIMCANNEIGTIQPIAEIGKIAREWGVLFHTDAVCAAGKIPIDVKAQNIDLLSISAHKLYGPKGVGALFVRKGIKLPPMLHGGGQEHNKRAGTENVPGIVGFGLAAEFAREELNDEAVKQTAIRDKIIDGLLASIPHCRLNGDRTKRLPGNANLSFEYVEGESILLMLDMAGFAASSGSACTSGSLDPSHVLLAIGLSHETAHGSLRITLGRYNTMAEADALLTALPPIIQKLRDMSPLYKKS